MSQSGPLSIEVAVGPTLADKFIYYNGSFHDGFFEGGAAWSYEAAIRGLYSFSDRWSAGIGFSYSRKGYGLKVFSLPPGHGFIRFGDTSEVVFPDIKYFHYYHYVEAPVVLRYNFVKNNKVQFYGQGGFAPNFYLTSGDPVFETNGEVNYVFKRHNFIHPLNLGLHSAVGVLLPVKENWKLGVESGLNCHIFRSEKGVYYRFWKRLYSFGLSFILSRSF